MPLKLTTFRGTVVSAAERVWGATSTGVTSSIHAIPEVWIASASGQERQFRAHFLSECRVGHEIMVATDSATSEPLGMRNLTTDGAWHARRLTMLVFGEPRSRDTQWEQIGPTLFYGAAILAAFALPTRWHRAEVRRRSGLRDEVSRALWATDK